MPADSKFHQILEMPDGLAVLLQTDKEIGDGFVSERLWHEPLEIKLFLAGSAEIICDSEVYTAHKGDIFVVNPRQLHSTSAHGGSARYHILMIDLFALRDSLADAGRELDELCDGRLFFNNRLGASPEAARLINSICHCACERPVGFRLSVTGMLCELLGLLLRTEVRGEGGGGMRPSEELLERLEPAFSFIHDSLARQIRLETLAALCSMSVKYFCRVFKSMTGMTAVTYINALRVNKAALLLKDTDSPVSLIAESCGFPDASYFNRTFKAYRGCSPSKFRRK